MPLISRDEMVRRLWLAGFGLDEDFDRPNAHCFFRPRDRVRVFVPKHAFINEREAERLIQKALDEQSARDASPCCTAESHEWFTFGGITILRCASCRALWERAAQRRPPLRLVK